MILLRMPYGTYCTAIRLPLQALKAHQNAGQAAGVQLSRAYRATDGDPLTRLFGIRRVGFRFLLDKEALQR
ncbi:MAG: hypothetical protein ACM3ZE_05570 [Myxococcales bacterium]